MGTGTIKIIIYTDKLNLFILLFNVNRWQIPTSFFFFPSLMLTLKTAKVSVITTH